MSDPHTTSAPGQGPDRRMPTRNRARHGHGRLGGAASAAAIIVSGLAVVLTQPGLVRGQSGYLSTWSAHYTASLSDNNASCILCHGVNASGTRNTGQLNAYGLAVFGAGTDAAAFMSIEGVDADGDGNTNIAEINAGTQPGWRTGATNTIYDVTDGSVISTNQLPPSTIGLLDPAAPTPTPVPPTPTPVPPTPTPVPTATASPTPTATATPAPTATATPSPTATPTPTDTTAPTTTVPVVAQRTNVALLGTAIPVSVTWTGADEVGGSGIAHYELQKSFDGGLTWVTVSATLVNPTTSLSVATAGTVLFQVRAVDVAGNTGAWVKGSSMAPRLVQDTSVSVHYTKSWTRDRKAIFSGGTVKYAKAKGATATLRTTGRTFALVTTKGKDRGYVWISFNGRTTKVNLYSKSTKARQVVWSANWSGGPTTIRIYVPATSGRPRVDLDAFVVIK